MTKHVQDPYVAHIHVFYPMNSIHLWQNRFFSKRAGFIQLVTYSIIYKECDIIGITCL